MRSFVRFALFTLVLCIQTPEAQAMGWANPVRWVGGGKKQQPTAPVETHGLRVYALDAQSSLYIGGATYTLVSNSTGEVHSRRGDEIGFAGFTVSRGSYRLIAELTNYERYEASLSLTSSGSQHYVLLRRRGGVTTPPASVPFDLNQVTIIGGSPDIRSWPVTSRVTKIEFSPDRFHIDHSRRGTWSPIDLGDGTLQEATVWIFMQINGRWYGTGGERLRPNQTDKQLTKPSDIGPGWFYDSNRWAPMAGFVPRPGDMVGFLVASGSTRADTRTIDRERTGVVLIPFPRDGVLQTYPPFQWEER